MDLTTDDILDSLGDSRHLEVWWSIVNGGPSWAVSAHIRSKLEGRVLVSYAEDHYVLLRHWQAVHAIRKEA